MVSLFMIRGWDAAWLPGPDGRGSWELRDIEA